MTPPYMTACYQVSEVFCKIYEQIAANILLVKADHVIILDRNITHILVN